MQWFLVNCWLFFTPCDVLQVVASIPISLWNKFHFHPARNALKSILLVIRIFQELNCKPVHTDADLHQISAPYFIMARFFISLCVYVFCLVQDGFFFVSSLSLDPDYIVRVFHYSVDSLLCVLLYDIICFFTGMHLHVLLRTCTNQYIYGIGNRPETPYNATFSTDILTEGPVI